MNVMMISQEIEDMKPVFKEFITELGYTEEQGTKFSEGYIKALSNFSTIRKLQALSEMDDECMSAGFINAEIDENEALNKFKSRIK